MTDNPESNGRVSNPELLINLLRQLEMSNYGRLNRQRSLDSYPEANQHLLLIAETELADRTENDTFHITWKGLKLLEAINESEDLFLRHLNTGMSLSDAAYKMITRYVSTL